MHKTFCYFLVFIYRPDKWSRILRFVLENPYSAPCGSSHDDKLGDSVLAGLLHLSLRRASHYLLVWCLWIYPRNDMKAITLHTIRVISQRNRSNVPLQIAFLSLWTCLILYGFHQVAAMCIGRETAGFCIWLWMTFPWSTALLSVVFWQT